MAGINEEAVEETQAIDTTSFDARSVLSLEELKNGIVAARLTESLGCSQKTINNAIKKGELHFSQRVKQRGKGDWIAKFYKQSDVYTYYHFYPVLSSSSLNL